MNRQEAWRARQAKKKERESLVKIYFSISELRKDIRSLAARHNTDGTNLIRLLSPKEQKKQIAEFFERGY